MISLSHEVYPEAARVRAHLDDARERVRRSGDRPLPRPAAGAAADGRLHERAPHRARRPAASRRRRPCGRKAVATIGSGPTGGVTAAARAAVAAGLGDVVSVDMGGTSYDVCLIRDGRPEITTDWNWRHRYCIALPMVDIHSIGAGGGSIALGRRARCTSAPLGRLASPGPVCYGRGGTEPTVTDADLVLGRLDPDGFCGGRMTLDLDAARDGRQAGAPAGPLGLRRGESRRAAVVGDRRRPHDRRHPPGAVARGRRPARPRPRGLRRHGRGARHGPGRRARHAPGARARPRPAFSALGLLTADHVVDLAAGLHRRRGSRPTTPASPPSRDELEARRRAELALSELPDDRLRFEWYANMVYPGQTFDVAIPCERPSPRPAPAASARAVGEFHRPLRGGPPHRGPGPGAGVPRRAPRGQRSRRPARAGAPRVGDLRAGAGRSAAPVRRRRVDRRRARPRRRVLASRSGGRRAGAWCSSASPRSCCARATGPGCCRAATCWWTSPRFSDRLRRMATGDITLKTADGPMRVYEATPEGWRGAPSS